MQADITVENHGSIFLFTTHTEAGREWWNENVGECMTFGGSYAVEHRCAWDIAQGALNDGLTVE